MAATSTPALPLARGRFAGLLYCTLFPLNLFSAFYVSARLIVPGDAAATAHNILASETLFRLGIVSLLLGQLFGLWVVLVLYQMFKRVDRDVAGLMLVFGLIAVPIGVLNELNHLAIPMVLHAAGQPPVFTADQLNSLVSLFLNLYTLGTRIDEIFWGLWLFPMGCLVYKSGFLPKILGIVLVIVCVGYLIQDFGTFLFPDLGVGLIMITGWGELLLPLWLLIRGVNVEEWKKRALEPA